MSANGVIRGGWSAITLAFAASIAACTVSAIAVLIVMENFGFPGITWTTLDKFFAVLFSYLQLTASTLYHSPVRRNGNIIEGMIFSDLGDYHVRTKVRRWMLQWFISVLCWSVVSSTIGIVIISAMKK